MTEDEAKAKWCPFARVVSRVGDGEYVVNRTTGDQDTTVMCIASACMAWREVPPTWNPENTALVRRGFCGLAGAPQ